jgi:uncharacterized protein YceH (UPF0502 family)
MVRVKAPGRRGCPAIESLLIALICIKKKPMNESAAEASPQTARWRTLERNERRVAGVLAEKAKTTPDNYPLSINAIVNGANQKSNRFPQMTLDEEQVQQALDSLRKAGAVALIQGDGRVEKYRHLLYDWLGVDKAELAVMTELMLRGAQTLGELRGRAARMEPIKDIGELMPIIDRLRQKNLLIYLSSPGRGGVVTHNLYQPQELAKVRAEFAGHGEEPTASTPLASGVVASGETSLGGSSMASPLPPSGMFATPLDGEIHQLRDDIAALKSELAELREEFQSLKNQGQ